MLIDIAYSPGVCVAENAAPVWRKSGSVDHRQVHVLRSIANSLLDHISGFVDGPGKHPIHDLLVRKLFGLDFFLLQIFFDRFMDFGIGDGFLSAVIVPTCSSLTTITSSLVNEFVYGRGLPALPQGSLKISYHMVVDIDTRQVAQSGRSHGQSKIDARFFNPGRIYSLADQESRFAQKPPKLSRHVETRTIVHDNGHLP